MIPESTAEEKHVELSSRRGQAATGRHVVLYVRDDFDATYPVRKWFDRPEWQARFLLRPEANDWLVWQVGSFAEVDGIVGRVDLDIMRTQGWRSPGA